MIESASSTEWMVTMCGWFNAAMPVLAPESLAALRIAGRGIRQGFQRDLALQPEIARPVDLAHSTDAEHGHDLVRLQSGPSVERHGTDSATAPLRPRKNAQKWAALASSHLTAVAADASDGWYPFQADVSDARDLPYLIDAAVSGARR